MGGGGGFCTYENKLKPNKPNKKRKILASNDDIEASLLNQWWIAGPGPCAIVGPVSSFDQRVQSSRVSWTLTFTGPSRTRSVDMHKLTNALLVFGSLMFLGWSCNVDGAQQA